jgi:threonine aldolase
MGTAYTREEIIRITDFAHKNDMFVHMDGARISNAAAGLHVHPREITGDAGVDVLCFGGTKNGMMYGEAVVFFNPSMARDFKYIRKQGMQLGSKMRFISAQFDALLSGDLWWKNACHANAMARLLAREAQKIPGVRITQKVEANGVFASIPPEWIPELQKEYSFYLWNEYRSEVRWMTAFDTSTEDVLNFVEALKQVSDHNAAA